MPGPGCPVQVMDLYTTSRGLKAGAYETNAAIRTGNAGTAIALKAATTGPGILMAEKMWRKNTLGAILRHGRGQRHHERRGDR